ncbi:MAG: nitronate monooxygenase [Patescibacteria group bacterium]
MEITSISRLKYPRIISGGMGVNISNWHLAREVSMFEWRNTAGVAMGTVSGVALEIIMARTLQSGGLPAENIKRALEHFPFPEVAEEVIKEFYLKKRGIPVWSISPSSLLIKLAVCANFAFVWLAKEGHANPISVNYLEKIAMPHIYAITGAMLAGIDFITIGAGIPLHIPKVISAIAEGRTATYRVPVIGEKTKSFTMSFNPKEFFRGGLPPMKIPGFIPIIASNFLASIFMRKLPAGSVYGFVIEGWKAGGHNAPPRRLVRDEFGNPQPIYGEEDEVDYEKIRNIGLPFWIGGGLASPKSLKWALSVGAKGLQVGSIFALSEDSGMRPDLRAKARELGFLGKLGIRKDMRFSPTGFPFQVAVLDGTLSEESVYDSRIRVCKHGALVSLYEKLDGIIGYRCPSEPVKLYIHKGGKEEDTVNRGCLCNGLISTAGFCTEREPPVVTLGDDVSFLSKVMASANSSYSAEDALSFLLGDVQ